MLKKYSIGFSIYELNFADVFGGYMKATGERVAIKIIRKDLLDVTGRKNLRRELKIQKALHHENVLPLLHYAEDQVLFFSLLLHHYSARLHVSFAFIVNLA